MCELDQLRILDGFRRFHARQGRLPSSAEAQASTHRRAAELASYAQIMRAFAGMSWGEISTHASVELGLDATAVRWRREAAMMPDAPNAAPMEALQSPGTLSDTQFELLWEISHVPRLYDSLDGRTIRALLARGLAMRAREWVHGAEDARAVLREHLKARARRAEGRAVAIYRALLDLEGALIPGAEVRVGRALATMDDVMLGFYREARALEARLESRGGRARAGGRNRGVPEGLG